MRSVKIIFGTIILFSLAGCSGNKTGGQVQGGEMAPMPKLVIKKDTISGSVEDKILDAVMSLPEVEDINRYIDSISNHLKGVATMMDPPEQGETDYSVRVGYNGDERFEVYNFFEVNPVTFKIKILDVDTFIPIEEYRIKNEKK